MGGGCGGLVDGDGGCDDSWLEAGGVKWFCEWCRDLGSAFECSEFRDETRWASLGWE